MLDRRELLALFGSAGLAGLACRPDGNGADPSVQRAQGGPPYQYKALDAQQAATVAVLVDCIIPATETPGAAAAGVPKFIDVIVGEWYHPDERTTFLAGLAELDRRSAALGTGRFTELSGDEQVALLEAVESEAFAARKADPSAPTPFWLRLKSLTVYGYYNSAVGSLQELDRPAIPGRFEGCDHLPGARPGAL
jgi:gluconate 2-dehydrogenase gamma chain